MEIQESEFTLIFYGLDAEQARLDLYDAGVSNRGFARTLAILGHYYITGEIIYQAPRSQLKLYAVAPQEGTFRQTVIAGAVGGIISAPFGPFASRIVDAWIPQPNNEMKQVVELLREQNRILRRQAGVEDETPEERAQQGEIKKHLNENMAKVQVLRSITSNSFKDVFRPIGRSAHSVGLTQGPRQRPVGAVDPQTLARIEADQLDPNESILTATVNAFSRSSRTGVAFSDDLGRGFRFEYSGAEKLLREDVFSWSQYFGRPLRLTGRFVRFFDGTIKKLIVYRAEKDQPE